MAGSVESVITGGRHPHRPDSMETNSHPINKTPAPTPTRTQTIHSHRPSPRFKKNHYQLFNYINLKKVHKWLKALLGGL